MIYSRRRLRFGGIPPSTKCARRENKLLKLKLDEHCHPRALKTKGCSSGMDMREFSIAGSEKRSLSGDGAKKF